MDELMKSLSHCWNDDEETYRSGILFDWWCCSIRQGFLSAALRCCIIAVDLLGEMGPPTKWRAMQLLLSSQSRVLIALSKMWTLIWAILSNRSSWSFEFTSYVNKSVCCSSFQIQTVRYTRIRPHQHQNKQ